MKKYRRVYAVIMSILFCVQMLPFGILADENHEMEVWTVEIRDIQTQNYLETQELVTLYGGDTQQVLHRNSPSYANDQYLLLQLFVRKNRSDDSSFLVSDCSLNLAGTTYSLGESGFLGNHGMEAFPKNEIRVGSHEGYLLFEIPKTANLSQATLEIGSISIPVEITQPEEMQYSNIPITENIMEEQWAIESAILEDYQLGEYSHKDPYLVLDPYQWAPLSALVLFETESPCAVSVVVEGKDAYSSIEHSFSTMKTFHQIPILGLYADYANQVEIICTDENGVQTSETVVIQTEKLMEDSSVVQVNVVLSQPEKMEEGMTFLAYALSGKKSVAIDCNGEIRWILNHMNRHELSRIDNGNFIVTNSDSTGFYEIDLLGKVYSLYMDLQVIHHDIYQLPSGNFLTTSHNKDGYEDRILELSRETGEVVQDIDFTKILDPERFNAFGNEDWMHNNAMVFDERDGTLLVSARQQGVFKITYPEGEIIWFTSLAEELEDLEDVFLQPVGEDFKPPIAQHAPMIIPDQDGNPDTIDILLYDNNVTKLTMPDYPENGLYSRIVQYRIDEKNGTIEEIWSYGEERGIEYKTHIVGDADLLANGNMLGTFGFRDYVVWQSDDLFNVGTIIEIEPETKEIIYEIDVKFNDKTDIYRAERLPIYPEVWDFALTAVKGEIKARNNYEQMQTEVSLKEISLLEVDESMDSAFYPEFNNNFYTLDVAGTQLLPDVSPWRTTASLVFQSLTNSFAVPLETCYLDVAVPYDLLEEKLPVGQYFVGILLESGDESLYRQSEYYFTVSSVENMVQSSDLLEAQNRITASLSHGFALGEYTFDEPFIVVNPYDMSPLSAIAIFTTQQPSQISVEVSGLRGGESLSMDYSQFKTTHFIPIYGLYPEEATKVTLTLTHGNGETESNTFSLSGEALPENMALVEVQQANAEKMFHGLTYYTSQDQSHYFYGVDSQGEVRSIFSLASLGIVNSMEFLENGNFLVSSEKTDGLLYYKNSIYEIDFTGKIYREYLLDSIHHDFREANNGNLLLVGNDTTGEVLEDTFYEISRETGEILRYWDADDYFPLEAFNEDGKRVSNETNKFSDDDWIHINSLDQHPDTGHVLISGKNHDVVLCLDLDTSEIQYIIGDHDAPFTKELKEKLLTPIGDDFLWQYGQHDAKFLENGDIILFDNGFYRDKSIENSIPAENGFSRIVIYRVNQEEMTIEEIWSYGEKLGSNFLSPYLSGVQVLGEDHYFINFGGILLDADGKPTYVVTDAWINGSSMSKQVELKNGEIIYRSQSEGTALVGNMYRSARLNPYHNDLEQDYFAMAERLGELNQYGTATMAALPTNLPETSNLLANFTDNGVQLVYHIQSQEEKDVENSLFFVSDGKSLEIPIASGNNLNGVISKSELPEDYYEIFLKTGNSLAKLDISWANGVDVPERVLKSIYSIAKTPDSPWKPAEEDFDSFDNTYFEDESRDFSHLPQGFLLLGTFSFCLAILSRIRNGTRDFAQEKRT